MYLFRNLIKLISVLLVSCLLLCGCSSLRRTQMNANDGGIVRINNSAKSVQVYSYAKKNSDVIWGSLKSNFSLPGETTENPDTLNEVNWDASHAAYFASVMNRSRPYLYYILQQVRKRGLPGELVLLPIVESAYNPFAFSRTGASGLWQIMPGTASGYGVKIDWWYDGRRDIIASTNAALDYLSYLNDFFNHNWLLAIAAYNSGEGTVEDAIEYNRKHNLPTDFWSLKLPPETRSYVPKILALATIIKNSDDYPVSLPDIPNDPYLASVSVDSQIDLTRASKMAGISLEELERLNPGYNRWATDPDGPQLLILPIENAARFQEHLSQTPKSELVTWVRYKIHSGDSLINIAKKYKTTVGLLSRVNKLSHNRIYVGDVLLIPTSTTKLPRIIMKSRREYLSSKRDLPIVHITSYVVQKGDTISKIADAYGLTSRKINFWNGLKRHEVISPGMHLILWPDETVRHISSKPKIKTTIFHHKVRSGDSLMRIANRYNVSVAQLRKENNLKSNMIKVGEILTIRTMGEKHHSRVVHSHKQHHATTHSNHKTMHKACAKITHTASVHNENPNITHYEIKKGDTINGIAQKLHVHAASLERWNGIKHPSDLRVGRNLIIYR